MVRFRYGIDHTNTSDDPETVLEIESTTEETKRINSIQIIDETNEGKMEFYVDREGFFEAKTYHKTAVATIENFLEFEIDRLLEPGEKFTIILQNYAAGVNAEIVGNVIYEIVE